MRLGDLPSESRQFPLFFETCTLEDFCARRGVVAIWLLDLPQEIRTGSYYPGVGEKSYLRLDIVRQLGNHTQSELAEVISNYPSMTLISNVVQDQERSVANQPNPYMQVPCWRHCGPYKIGRDAEKCGIWVVSTLSDLPLANLLHEFCKTLIVDSSLTADLLLPTDEDCALAVESQGSFASKSHALWSQENILRELNLSISTPICVIDVSSDPLVYSILRETLTRNGVTWRSIHDADHSLADCISGSTIGNFLASLVNSDRVREDGSQVQSMYAADAGWGSVWHSISKLTLV
jgi:hypothetical protein